MTKILISAMVPTEALERRKKLDSPKWGYLVMRGIRALEDEPELNATLEDFDKRIKSATSRAQQYAQMYYNLIEEKNSEAKK